MSLASIFKPRIGYAKFTTRLNHPEGSVGGPIKSNIKYIYNKLGRYIHVHLSVCLPVYKQTRISFVEISICNFALEEVAHLSEPQLNKKLYLLFKCIGEIKN